MSENSSFPRTTKATKRLCTSECLEWNLYHTSQRNLLIRQLLSQLTLGVMQILTHGGVLNRRFPTFLKEVPTVSVIEGSLLCL